MGVITGERRRGTVLPVLVRDFVVKFGDWGAIFRREIGGPVLLLFRGNRSGTPNHVTQIYQVK